MPPIFDKNLELFISAIEKIEDFEKQGVVTRWRYRGFHVWPIVKYVIVKQMVFAMNRNYSSSDRYKRYPNFAKRNRLRPAYSRLLSRKPADSLRSVDTLPIEQLKNHKYWCLGSGSGFYDLDGEKASQHHHALRVALMENGHRSIGLYSGFDPDTMPARSEYGPHASLDPFIKNVALTARVPKLSHAFLYKHFKSLESVVSLTGHGDTELCAFVDTVIGRVDHAANCFTYLFRSMRPDAIITSNYASFYGWALAHVCRLYDIPYIDIQHGIEGRFNGSYYFKNTPKMDWSTCPTAHMCWTESDAESFRRQNAKRRAAVVGPTWEQFAKFLPDQSDRNRRTLSDFQSRNGPLVLFAAQQAGDILLAQKLHQSGLNILFRCHPLRKDETEKLVDATQLAALGCSLAFETPLPSLLDAVDGVITGYSAVILEACLKGVAVLATGSYASLLEADYARELDGLLTIKSGIAGDEKMYAVLEWARRIERESSRKVQSRKSYSDALEALGITQ